MGESRKGEVGALKWKFLGICGDTMITTRKNLIKQIHEIWPDLVDGYPGPSNIAIPDNTYWLPTKRDLEWRVVDTFMDQYRYKAESFDCDDFALVLHAFVVQERYVQIERRELSKDEWFPWAFGQVWGTRFRGQPMGHAINVCLTSDDGIILLEPQNDQIWEANTDRDHVHFVRI